jgi:hypothetical protein
MLCGLRIGSRNDNVPFPTGQEGRTMAITLSGDELADKYETKREGLTCDEALEATVLGYKVRSPSIPANAYIHYPGEGGWRIQFVHDGRDGSSSGWTPDRPNWLEEWSIVPDKDDTPRDAWGKPVTQWPIDNFRHGFRINPHDDCTICGTDTNAVKRDSWGRPVNAAS